MKNIVLLFACMAILIASCKKKSDENPTPTPPASFSYLKSGTVWKYKNSDTDPNHAGISYESTYTLTSRGTDGWCTVVFAAPGFSQNLEWFVDNTMWSDMAQKAAGIKYPLIKASPVLNDQYTINGTDGVDTFLITRKVLLLTQTVTVPAGTYSDCTVIHETTSNDSKYYKDLWISAANGIVRTEGTTTADYPIHIILELVSKTP